MAKQVRQVNIRVDRAVYDVLETVRYLRDLRGMQELLEPVVESFASAAASDDKVERALAARRENLAEERPKPEE